MLSWTVPYDSQSGSRRGSSTGEVDHCGWGRGGRECVVSKGGRISLN